MASSLLVNPPVCLSLLLLEKGPSVKSEAANEALASLYFFSRSLSSPDWSGSSFIKPADSFAPIYIKVLRVHTNTHNMENTHVTSVFRETNLNQNPTFQAAITAPVVQSGAANQSKISL